MASHNTVISIILRAVDKTRSAFRSAAQGATDAANAIENAERKVGGLHAALNKLGSWTWKGASTLISLPGKIFSIGANLGGFVQTFQSAFSTIQSIFTSTVATVQSLSTKLWGAIQESFKFESLTIQFKTLLGSTEEAKRRMASLAEFAEVTPFNLEEVVKASRTLTVMSDNALGTEYSLRLVGDAAAATGASFEEVAFWVGRAYAMIKGGQPFGEAALRLQELGILTPAVRTEMEALQASGAKNSEVWEAFAARLEEFDGAMVDLSQTGDGLTSTLEDTWTAAVREFGDAFQDAAKESIGELITILGKLKADGTIKEWAQSALAALTPVKDLVTAVLGGGEERASALKAAWDYLKAVFDYGGKVIIGAAGEIGLMLARAFPATFNAIGRLFGVTQLTEWMSGYSAQEMEEDFAKMLFPDKKGFRDTVAEANQELKEASTSFADAVAKEAASTRERVAAEAEAAKAAAQPEETDEEAKQKAKDDLDRQQRETETKAALAEWSAAVEEHKRLKAIAEERARLEEEYSDVQREQTELAEEVKDLDKKLKEAKEKELEFKNRALDSDFDKQKREEEKAEKKKKDREEKLEKEAEALKKRFATLSDPDALLRDDFDVSKLGHHGRAVREWLRNGKFVAYNQYSFDHKLAQLKAMNGTLKEIQTNLDNLLRQS